MDTPLANPSLAVTYLLPQPGSRSLLPKRGGEA
jgi:hypothetical protein